MYIDMERAPSAGEKKTLQIYSILLFIGKLL